jgi:hypothetical protein
MGMLAVKSQGRKAYPFKKTRYDSLLYLEAPYLQQSSQWEALKQNADAIDQMFRDVSKKK